MANHKPKMTEKPCAYCGAPIQWTRNNATTWNSVQYCDNACKRQANRKLGLTLDPTANTKGPATKPKKR